ncbi:MAG TPA: Qat anti-phage system TatD family nuclease QatD [Phycisphaerae bacterium]|nr:Qat anti-phage system TatD family nuclease QatD [Phycisphaerae bacterium]
MDPNPKKRSFPSVDTHCHVDLFPDPAAVVAACERARVYTIAVTNAPFVFKNTQELAATSTFVRPAAGLHPELVESHGEQIESLLDLLTQTRYVGEVGLDYVVKNDRLHERQRELFQRIISRCAKLGNKILTIHSRRAAKDVIAIIGENFPGRIILHWFSGSVKEAEDALAAGFYFSINVAMVRAASGRKIISLLPKDRVLTESDGPFVKENGEGALPTSVERVVESLSEIWKIGPEDCGALVFNNFRRLLELASPR